MRATWSVALSLSVGCSFVDDFDKFHAGDARVSVDAALDAAAQDAGGGELEDATTVDATSDAVVPMVVDCAAAVDGARCGDGLICRFKACVASTCGDGYIDGQRGELCDEANLVRGDGCEPLSCTFSCDEDGDCDDARVCNGKERCDLSSHRCVQGLAASAAGQSCTTSANVGGICKSGLCVPEGCGNGTLEQGETCEPMMTGCRIDCQPGCKGDADCRNADACDGEESCDLGTRECRAGVRLACADDDVCTVDGICDPSSGCLFRLIDEDRDSYPPASCANGSGRMPDCNDANANVWPGGSERCDLIDNDCDGQIDEEVMLHCFADRDGDGFPARGEQRTGCSCPAGTMAVIDPATYVAWDCWDDPLDQGARVHPGQTGWFEDGYGPGGRRERSFDFDCDGQATPRYGALDAQGCTGLLGLVCDMKQGFQGPPPSCGEGATYITCVSGTLACEARQDTRKQGCR